MLLPTLVALAVFSRTEPGAVRYQWRRVSIRDQRVEAMAVPTKGAEAFVALGGVGAILRDLQKPDPIPMTRVDGVAIGDYTPDVVVAVGQAETGGNLRFSLDGGQDWRACPHPPELQGGSVAVSPEGRLWVWSGVRAAQRSDDYGFTWTPCEGLPAGARIVADRTAFRRFYSIAEGQLYVSDDGGRSFDAQEVVLPGASAEDAVPIGVFPTPGRAGDLWLHTRGALYHMRPGGSFVRVPGVTDPVAFGFGQGAYHAYPGNTLPSLFLAGTVSGRAGLFRSDDGGVAWTPVLGAPSVPSIESLAGDPKRRDHVFVALKGGGLLRGSTGR